MVDGLSLVRGAWAVMIALVLLLLLEADAWRRDIGYNRALAAQDYARAAVEGLPRQSQAARAYALEDEAFDEKVLDWSRLMLGNEVDPSLARNARFNLANLYLRRAINLDLESDRDLLVPLVEQAKQHYRTLLIDNPSDFDAKYNLELTLLLLPEVADLPADEERNPERSERAISTMRVEEQLP